MLFETTEPTAEELENMTEEMLKDDMPKGTGTGLFEDVEEDI